MIDANCNRVMEGLRTLEDVARFSGFSRLQVDYKGIRHELGQAIFAAGQDSFVSARDAQGDVGRESKTQGESERSGGLISIVSAAGARVEQGLRVLEECFKVHWAVESGRVERLRYRVYDLNAELRLGCQRDIGFLRGAKLYVLVDCQWDIEEFGKRISEISQAGVDLIQIRDKQADPIRIIEYLQVAVQAVQAQRTRIVVNDRVDIAATTDSAGVHVGQEDLSVARSRRLLQPWQILGLSTHTIQQVCTAVELGVEYIGCGPTFVSQTKRFESFSGIEFLREAADWLVANAPELPAFAIGGIDTENLPEVLGAGFARVAVGSCVWKAENPAKIVEKLRSMLDRGNA